VGDAFRRLRRSQRSTPAPEPTVFFVSRDSRELYVSNRGEGSISAISFKSNKQTDKWRIPGGGSPDMGGISANGRVLWVSGRYDGVVYALDTSRGKLMAKIPVGNGPHGLCLYPQPGRYSLATPGCSGSPVRGRAASTDRLCAGFDAGHVEITPVDQTGSIPRIISR
jgi:DNA-binding beta-propeller fold protein YncE